MHVLTADVLGKFASSFPVSQSHNLAELSAEPVSTRVESPDRR